MTRCDSFTLIPSTIARVVFLLVPFFTAILILGLPVEGRLKALLFCCLLANMMWYRVNGYRLAELKYRDGEWFVRKRDVADEKPCQLKTAVVMPGVVRLIFDMEGRSQAQLVFQDSLPKPQWRSLHRLLNQKPAV